MADAGAVSASAISLGQTVTAYQFFLPRLSEVRQADPGSVRGDVLLGQVAAGALSLATGALLSSMTGSPMPTYTALFIAVIIGGVYQYAMTRKAEA